MVPPPRKPLRLWPGIVLVALQWLVRFVLPVAVPGTLEISVLGALAAFPLILLWWLFFSRARWSERLGALVVLAAALAAGSALAHPSITTGAQGMLYFILALPVVCLGWVGWAVATRTSASTPSIGRWATLAITLCAAAGSIALLRTGGFTADFDNDLDWRWAPTPEERLLASADDVPEAETVAAPAMPTEPSPPDWPGYRGPGRDGDVPGLRIATAWSASPPEELWRRPVGPAWSSFAVDGDRIFTQEQRGDDETVSCYDAATGTPVWMHTDPVRFWESNGGAGPRGTPTLHDGRVYTLGGTGLVNALDAATGARIWSRDGAADAEMETPTWGFSASPLVVGDTVYVAVSGRLVAYDLATGTPRWRGHDGGASYSSAHWATIAGTEQVLQLAADGLTSFDPADGTVLWQHAWEGYPIVQPVLAASDAGTDILVTVNAQSGIRRLAVEQVDGTWSVTQRWETIRLKPYFNDFVVHGEHAYGFDGSILASIDLATGERAWKGGRYGHGQMLLLPDQDLLLVLSEQGEIALVRAAPDGYEEIAKIEALDGKTWNHPVLVPATDGGLLLVRNDREMVAYRLAPGG